MLRWASRVALLMVCTKGSGWYAVGHDLAEHDERNDAQHDRADAVVLQGLHGFSEHVTDAAGAHEAEDRGASEVDLQREDHVADEHGQHLWHDAIEKNHRATGACGFHGFDRPAVYVLYRFGRRLRDKAERS